MPVIPALGRLKQEGGKFEASRGYIGQLGLHHLWAEGVAAAEHLPSK
jgi:hypothetical protein